MHKLAAKSCNWHCSIQVELPSVPLGLLSHCRGFTGMSKYVALPKCFYVYPSMVLSLAYNQLLLSSCKTTLSHEKSLASQDYSYGIVFMNKNMMAEISGRSSIFSLWSASSVHLNPRSLATRSHNLKSVAAPMHGAVQSSSPVASSSDCSIMIPDKEEY